LWCEKTNILSNSQYALKCVDILVEAC